MTPVFRDSFWKPSFSDSWFQPSFFCKPPQHHQLLKNHSNTCTSNQHQSTLIERYLLGTSMSPPIAGTFDLFLPEDNYPSPPALQKFPTSNQPTWHVFHLDFGEVLYPQTTHPAVVKTRHSLRKICTFSHGSVRSMFWVLLLTHVIAATSCPCFAAPVVCESVPRHVKVGKKCEKTRDPRFGEPVRWGWSDCTLVIFLTLFFKRTLFE